MTSTATSTTSSLETVYHAKDSSQLNEEAFSEVRTCHDRSLLHDELWNDLQTHKLSLKEWNTIEKASRSIFVGEFDNLVFEDRLHLLEVCCGPESVLTDCVRRRGGRAERAGLHNGCNVTTRATPNDWSSKLRRADATTVNMRRS